LLLLLCLPFLQGLSQSLLPLKSHRKADRKQGQHREQQGQHNCQSRSVAREVADPKQRSPSFHRQPVHNTASLTAPGVGMNPSHTPSIAAFRYRSGWIATIGDNKTPLELFVAGVRGWEAAVRRRMTGEMPAKLH
jgi:hypothetical protein